MCSQSTLDSNVSRSAYKMFYLASKYEILTFVDYFQIILDVIEL